HLIGNIVSTEYVTPLVVRVVVGSQQSLSGTWLRYSRRRPIDIQQMAEEFSVLLISIKDPGQSAEGCTQGDLSYIDDPQRHPGILVAHASAKRPQARQQQKAEDRQSEPDEFG